MNTKKRCVTFKSERPSMRGRTRVSLTARLRRFVYIGVALYVMGSGTALLAATLSVKSFDAPGAGTDGDTQQGTIGVAINEFGTIAGEIRDSNDVRHGFLRHPDGTFTVFDHPDAGTNGATEQGTKVEGMNLFGAVIGQYRDANNFDHPYIREPDGRFVTIPIPNLLGGDGSSINLWGAAVGNFLNLTDVQNYPVLLHYHGFLRDPKGTVTLFDPPGSTDTEIPPVGAINDEGSVTGDFWVCNTDQSACTAHGFIRRLDGKYFSFDVEGAGPDAYSGQGTFPQSINDVGEVVGYYVDVNDVGHGFVRNVGGVVTHFDIPTVCTTGTPPEDCAYEGTYPDSINNLGTVTGTYYGENGLPHGFWRSIDGSMKRFDLEQAGYSTYPSAINDLGVIAGFVYDSNFAVHGFYALPQ